MSGAYTYTTAVWLPLVAGIFLAGIGLFSWRRRDVAGAAWLAAGSFIGCLLPLGVALEVAAVLPAVKIAWHSFRAALILLSVAATTCFVLDYTSGGRWLTRRNLALVWAPALVLLLAIVVAGGDVLGPAQIAAGGRVERTASRLSAVFLAYGIGLLLVNTAAFLWLFAHSAQHRWPVALMLVAQTAGRGAFALNVLSPDSPVPFDPAVGSTLLIWTVYAIVLFGFRIFDPLPAARLAVYEQMHAGVVVFDAGSRVLGLNPAAEEILGLGAGLARHKTWQQLGTPERPLPRLPDPAEYPAGGAAELPDMILGAGSGARHYAPGLSTLTDFRGLPVGRLLILRDLTEQRRAEAEALEQQRVLVIQKERERMARELHDSLGQVLSYTSLQVETAAQLALTGQGEAAAGQLARLGEVVREAHADLREQIFNLASTAPLERSFFSTAKQYLEGFTRSYSIRTLLDVDPALGEGNFPPEMKLQLLRILQEALSNARKHGRAHQAGVSFTADNDRMSMIVVDDGCGFDPKAVAHSDGAHYGLDFMRSRAAELGGRLDVTSEPGCGTRVTVQIPMNASSQPARGGSS